MVMLIILLQQMSFVIYPIFLDWLRVLKFCSTERGFIFEEPYLGDIIKKCSYDQIYDEHVFCFHVYQFKSYLRR